jgi:ornithine carbamoyltransferase
VEAAALYGLTVRIACPEGFDPDTNLITQVEATGRGRVEIHRSAATAAAGADVLYTDVWASMGQEAEREKRLPIFESFRIDSSIVAKAKKGAVVLHCLPAHRGEEITDDVIEGPQSAVFDQAENRLHLQKAILHELLAGGRGKATKGAASKPNAAARKQARPAARKQARRAAPRSRRAR